MREQKRAKTPNALKHGIFTPITILPGEDLKEFIALYRSVIEEWIPHGATEEEAVLTITNAMWRKRRLQKFIQIQVFKNMADPKHASYNGIRALKTFDEILRLKPEDEFEVYADGCLRQEMIDRFKSKFPRHKYNSTADRTEAVRAEIKSIVETNSAIIPNETFLLLSCATVFGDLFKQELALEERLNAIIERSTKQLLQIKAMKQMLGQTHTGQHNGDVMPSPIAQDATQTADSPGAC
jgi:hypothetical protein